MYTRKKNIELIWLFLLLKKIIIKKPLRIRIPGQNASKPSKLHQTNYG